jgi:small-conductance mechanosensitive channel
MLAVVFGLASCLFIWHGRPAWLRRAGAPADVYRREILLARWSLPLLASVLIANVLGFLVLSQLLRLSILLCICFALVLYTLVRVIETVAAATLRLPRLLSLASVRMHGNELVIWISRIARLGFVLWWLDTTLRLLDIRDAAVAAIAAVLNASTGIRGFDFSLGGVLGFLSVLLFGSLLARGLRFFLREEILTRCRLSRGVPETISNSFYYVALLLVFLMSLNAVGVELDKLTLMTGALGVGLGFGMQNIVNNFVSGLILQFERPIRVGDALEVGELGGEVRHIGIRASTIRTWQGADVIIPNSTFISGQVINWTLSEPYRRVDVPVHVAYGTDPERVLDILLDVAGTHPEVLRTPKPCAVFQGFGESALNFLLMFWAEQNTHFRLRSEICIQITSVLRAAGIEVPVPQREIRMRSSEAAALRGHA